MKITRRHFLRANGAVLTLPFLHSLPSSLQASSPGNPKPDKKLVIVYLPNGVVRRCFFPGEENGELPGFIGGFNADKIKNQKRIENVPGIYPLELTSTLQPLKKHADDVTLITGLDRSYKNGQEQSQDRHKIVPVVENLRDTARPPVTTGSIGPTFSDRWHLSGSSWRLGR